MLHPIFWHPSPHDYAPLATLRAAHRVSSLSAVTSFLAGWHLLPISASGGSWMPFMRGKWAALFGAMVGAADESSGVMVTPPTPPIPSIQFAVPYHLFEPH